MLAQCCKRRATIRLTLCQRLEFADWLWPNPVNWGIDLMLFLCRADVEDVGPLVELPDLSLCFSHLCYLTNIAIRPWLRYLSPKISKFLIIINRFLDLAIEGNGNWYNLYTSGLKYDQITTFIAMPVHVVKLAYSLQPSVMKKRQSMVKYTFFKI